jgi:hypothetical protein
MAGSDLSTESCGGVVQAGEAGSDSTPFAGNFPNYGQTWNDVNFTVSEEALALRVTMNGSQQSWPDLNTSESRFPDFDLYLSNDGFNTAACASERSSQAESCFVSDPAPGPWSAGVFNYAGVPGEYQLTVTEILPTPSPTPTPTPTPAPTATPIPLTLQSPAGGVFVGSLMTLQGTGFSAGSVIKAYVSTAFGPVDYGPYTPDSWTPTSLDWTVPEEIQIGNGYVNLQIINTDQGYIGSNYAGARLVGAVAAGYPEVTHIDSTPLGAMSASFPLNFVETIAPQGSTITISGSGFNLPLVNLFSSLGNLGPLTPLPGGTSTEIQVTIPADAPTGPGAIVVVNTGSGYRLSNAVSLPIGAALSIDSITQVGSVVTVTGTGFSPLSVINLFNQTPSGVLNLGGLNGAGTPYAPLNVISDTQFSFVVPGLAAAGPAYVQVLNPPYIPFSSSGNTPNGAFTIVR